VFRHAVGFCEHENPSVVLKLTDGVFFSEKIDIELAVPMKERLFIFSATLRP